MQIVASGPKKVGRAWRRRCEKVASGPKKPALVDADSGTKGLVGRVDELPQQCEVRWAFGEAPHPAILGAS